MLLSVPFGSSAFAFLVAQAIPLFSLGFPLSAFAFLPGLPFGLVALALDSAFFLMKVVRGGALFVVCGSLRVSAFTLLAPLFALPIDPRLLAVHDPSPVLLRIRLFREPR
jgi:hypothetical protein